MAIAGGAVHSIEVWLNDDGQLCEGHVQHRSGSVCFSDVAEVILELRKESFVHVYMQLYGFNLVTLREAFDD